MAVERRQARKYADALDRLANELVAASPPVNYQHRRARLQDWVLMPNDWKKITEAVVRRLEPGQCHRIRWDRARHLAASALVWAQVTHGEWQWAPMLQSRPAIGLIEIKRARFSAYALTLPVLPSRGPGLLARLLHDSLHEHADKLAERIDSDRPQRIAVTSFHHGPQTPLRQLAISLRLARVTIEVPYQPLPIHQSDVRYLHGPDSAAQPGVPAGETFEFDWNVSEIYPGTSRRFWVHVPARYNPSEPASLMVFQDGWCYLDPDGEVRGAAVLDNLVHRGDIPVTIGVFVNPGIFPGAQDPKNRNTEYEPPLVAWRS